MIIVDTNYISKECIFLSNREGLDTTAATDDNEDDECISDEEIETTEVDFSHRIKTNEEI